MSTFPKIPKPHIDNVSAIADFAEIYCLQQSDRNISITDVASAISLSRDEDEDDRIQLSVVDAFGELEERLQNCGENDGRYPFSISSRGELLQFKGIGPADAGLNYLYLLLATRLNMRDDRVHGGCDGALLFEELSKEAAVRFLGGPAPTIGSMVFGTARFGQANGDDELDHHSFREAVNSLCKEMGEGFGYRANPDLGRSRAKDDKLDVVVWRKFADKRPGKLIAFGQCKTGTSWQTELSTLQPQSFCVKWMDKAPPVSPIRLFFVADRVPKTNWSNRCTDAGILFDRCRITECASSQERLPSDLMKRIGQWTKAVARAKGLNLK